MQRAMIMALVVLCLSVFPSCTSEQNAVSSAGPGSLKVVNLESFHELPGGRCLPLAQGSTRQHVTIVTKDGLVYDDWYLDAASARILTSASIGSCFMYAHTQYQVAA